MIEIPKLTISWGMIKWVAVKIVDRVKIDVTFEKTPKNPFIMVAYDTARVRYQLIIHTHGWPKCQPNVVFTKVKSLGSVVKRAVSPSGLGEVNGSMRLKLYKNEIPSNSKISLNVDFEIKINTGDLVAMDFSENREILDENNPMIEVLCTNECDFALEQIFLTVRKDSRFQADNPEVLILDKSSHRVQNQVAHMAIRKGDDYIKWMTSFEPKESLLFRVVARARS